MRSIAIIPARSGSKGLKHKNIKLLNGKPLLAYTIEAAKESNCFDIIHVSTDSNEYAEIAKHYGADVPFLRDNINATDNSSSWDVVREVLKKYEALGFAFDTFMLLQPTSPFRTADDIKEAFEELQVKNAKAIVSVCETDHSVGIMNSLPDDKSMNNFLRVNVDKARRQDFEKYYRLNGAIYLSQTSTFLETGNIYENKCYATIMTTMNSIDIDTSMDFALAETMMKKESLHKRLRVQGVIEDSKLHSRIAYVCDQINCGNIDNLPLGEYEINDWLTLNITEYFPKAESNIYEAHCHHVDIHYVITGEEKMLFSSANAEVISKSTDDDYVLFASNASEEQVLNSDLILVCNKNIKHQPGIRVNSNFRIKKAVYKILV